MTITYNLGPQHKWRFFYPSSYGILAETPLVGGLIYTYQSSSHTTAKTTYSSNIGSPPPANTNPIVLDANGEAPVYLLYDDSLTALQNEYYIEVRDPNNVLIDSFDMYNTAPLPATSGTNANGINNYIKNPQFYWNHYSKPTIKLSNVIVSPTLYTGTYVSDEWTFTKNNSQATETVIITAFTPGQSTVPNQPVNYLSWACTGAGTTETYKNIFQSIAGSQTFATQTIWIQFFARSNNNMQLLVNLRQYFGSGGSADVVSNIFSQNLTTGWQFYTSSLIVPSCNGKTINAGDAIQIELQLPLNTVTNLDITNIALTLNGVAPTLTSYPYESNSETINKENQQIFNIPTGETDASFTSTIPGYIALNVSSGTIGNVASTATVYANENAYPLYALLWNGVSNTYCPVSAGRGANPLADFDANKTLQLPASLNSFLVTAGSSYALGQTGGASAITIATSQLPAHTHTLTSHVAASSAGWTYGQDANGGGPTGLAQTANLASITDITATDATGSGGAITITPPYLAINQFIKT